MKEFLRTIQIIHHYLIMFVHCYFTTLSHFLIIMTMGNFANVLGDSMINGKNCILIVDDEQKIVRALSDYFAANKYIVLKAYDGEEALDVFYENVSDIDLIILDVMMPKINGFDVLKTLREQSYLVSIIIPINYPVVSSEATGFFYPKTEKEIL